MQIAKYLVITSSPIYSIFLASLVCTMHYVFEENRLALATKVIELGKYIIQTEFIDYNGEMFRLMPKIR